MQSKTGKVAYHKLEYSLQIYNTFLISGQGMSDVATILARRVAVEFSDSDDCASESEYDSDDWGERELTLIVFGKNEIKIFCLGETDA